jgi:hypothetical protein
MPTTRAGPWMESKRLHRSTYLPRGRARVLSSGVRCAGADRLTSPYAADRDRQMRRLEVVSSLSWKIHTSVGLGAHAAVLTRGAWPRFVVRKGGWVLPPAVACPHETALRHLEASRRERRHYVDKAGSRRAAGAGLSGCCWSVMLMSTPGQPASTLCHFCRRP